jgi:hypothetical protein
MDRKGASLLLRRAGMDNSAKKKAAWTVMVYMAGDNNLTEEMAWGLQELKKTASSIDEQRPGAKKGDVSDRINVVAHFDPRGSRSRRYDFVPTEQEEKARADGNLERYAGMIYTRGNSPVSTLQATALEEQVAPPSPVTAFATEQVRRLPAANRYFLILSGHGSGAVGDFLIDSDPKTSLSIPELGLILRAACEALGSSAKGKEPGKPVPLDIVGMDSCLMSNAEVCFEIREHADYLVGSEGWVANAGWPYHRVLEACIDEARKPIDDAARVAVNVAQGYSVFYQDYEIAGVSTDIAVCRLEALRDGGVAQSLRALSKHCTEAFDGAFVDEALPKNIDATRVQAVLVQLSEAIAESLLPKGEAREWLALRLVEGTTLAKNALREPPSKDVDLCPSQWRAVRALAQAGDRVDLGDGDLTSKAREQWQKLQGAIDGPASASEALAAVALLREFDPGVLDALELVEQQERAGQSSARRARALLQKLHQVRWLTELNERRPKRHQLAAHVRLLNAVAAARWRAQSFKAGVYVDLIDFCEVAAGRLDEESAKPFRVAAEAVRSAVLMSRQTGASSQHAEGLSVYFPSQAGDYAVEYDTLQFAKLTGWGRLVRSYLRATRRGRWYEQERWAAADDQVLRFERSEVDPLDPDGIEARIVGVTSPPGQSSRGTRIDAELRRLTREAVGADAAEAAEAVVAQVAKLLEASPADRDAIEKTIAAGIDEAVGTLTKRLPEKMNARIDALVRAKADGEFRAGIEERIRAGIEERVRAGIEERVRAGIEERVRAGIEERVRAGIEERIRAGIEERIRAGTEERIRAGIEERIRAGIEERVRAGIEESVRAGIEERVRQASAPPAGAGVVQGRAGNGLPAGLVEWVRAGTEEKIRAGTEEKVRTGTEAKIRGDGGLFVWGNPPDGFRRQDLKGKPNGNGRVAKV